MNLDGLEHHANAMLTLAADDSKLEIEARLMLARHGIYRGQYTQALSEAEHAHTLTGKMGAYAAESLLLGGTALVGCGRLSAAETRLLDGLKLEKHGEMYAELHSVLKEVYRQQGNLPKALEHARASHTAYQKIGKHDSEITMLAQIGQMLGAMGQSEEALGMLEKAVKQAREMGFERVLSFVLVFQAQELIKTGEFEKAEQVVAEGLQFSKGKLLARECQFTSMLGSIKRRTGRFGEAIEIAQHALDLSNEIQLPVQQVFQNLFLADVYLDLGALELALGHLKKTSDLITQSGLTVFILSLETLQARIELITKKPQSALTRLKKIESSLKQAPVEHQLMFVTTLAQTQLEVGNIAQTLLILNNFSAPIWLKARAHNIQLRAILSKQANINTLKEQVFKTQKFLTSTGIMLMRPFAFCTSFCNKKMQYKKYRISSRSIKITWRKVLKQIPNCNTIFSNSTPLLEAMNFLERFWNALSPKLLKRRNLHDKSPKHTS